MAMSIEELRTVAARVRAQAAAAGELVPSKVGLIHWDIPDAARTAILEDVAAGAYEPAAREATTGDPEITPEHRAPLNRSSDAFNRTPSGPSNDERHRPSDESGDVEDINGTVALRPIG